MKILLVGTEITTLVGTVSGTQVAGTITMLGDPGMVTTTDVGMLVGKKVVGK